jgi:hypothetical protein
MMVSQTMSLSLSDCTSKEILLLILSREEKATQKDKEQLSFV